MPTPWDTGEPIINSKSVSKWDTGTPIINTTATEDIQPQQPTPEAWNKAPAKKEDKPSWDSGIQLGAPKGGYQRFIEGVLGEGAVTGEFDKMTAFGKTLDLMGRPGYAVKSVILENQKAIQQALIDAGVPEDEINNPLSTKRREVMYKIRPKIDPMGKLKAAWRGLSGEERVTANQLWENVGVRGIPFLGFAMEVATDPLMWALTPIKAAKVAVTGGTIRNIEVAAQVSTKMATGYELLGKGAGVLLKPVGKGISMAYGQARKIEKFANTADFVIDKGNELGKATYQMFVAKSKIPELAQMVDSYLTKRKWMGGSGINFAVQTRDAIVKEAKLSGKKIEEVERNIVNIIELPKQYKQAATSGERMIAEAIQHRLEKAYTEMTQAGVPITSLGMARRGKLDELYKSLETAVGEQKVKLLKDIDAQKLALQDEILGLKTSLKPLGIDVSHWSTKTDITDWRINSKTVDNDLGTDFGTEKAALARKQDIGKDIEGKLYHTTIYPRKSIDLTGLSEQLQYWDDPNAVLESIYKAGAINITEYNELKAAIPQTQNFKKVPKQATKSATSKPKVKMVASPKGESGLQLQINWLRKNTPLTDDEIEAIGNLHEVGEVIMPTDDVNRLMKITWNPKTKRYGVYTIEGKAVQPESVIPVAQSSFDADAFYRAQNQWYSNFRQKLTNKGYDSIKYYALEDAETPTYKVLTNRIIGKVSRKELNAQEKMARLITKKETEVSDLVNKAINIYHEPVTEADIANTAKKLKVNRAEAKEYAQIQKAREMGYFPRFTSKEAQAFLRDASKSRGLGEAVWNPKIKNALERRTADFTLDEWNKFCAENGIKELGGKKIEEYFLRDPAYAVALYDIRAAKAITSAEFLQDVITRFGKSGKAVPVGWQELPAEIIKLYPQAKGIVFDPEVIKEVTRITEHYINPAAAGPVLQIIDGVQNMWRKWTLAPFPKYHIRNMVGNLWNNYLADVHPDTYGTAQAIQLYRKYRGTGGNLEKLALTELNLAKLTPEIADDIILSAEKHGVLGHGWYGSDVEIGIQQQLNRKALINRGVAIGSTVENNARLAHYISKMQDGMPSAEAALSVKKYLFDYSDITSFEREVMRRLFPFYTWTRKNLPLQLQELYNQPQKFAPLTIPFRLRNEEDIVRLKYTRPDLYERLPIELQRTMDTVTYVPLEGLIPAGDLAKMVRPHELLFELLTPYLRAPIELYMNRSMYFQADINKYDNETQELWRMDIPVSIKYLLTTVLPQARLLTEIDKIVKKKDTKAEELTPAELVVSQSLTSIYKTDLKELRNRALGQMKKKIEELRKGMATAKRNDRLGEEARIKKTYEQLKQEIHFIKGD